MNQLVRILAATALSFASTAFATGAAISPAQLSSPQGTLTLEQRGISLAPRHAACPPIVAQDWPLWTLVLQTPSTPSAAGTRRVLSAAGQQARQEATADCVRLVYDKLTDGEQTWQIRLALEIRKSGDGFQISGELRNDADGWIVRELKCPILGGITADPAVHPLLWPNGLGQRFSAASPGSERSFSYPSGTGTMQWCAFAGAAGGLYLGCHDAAQGGKTFSVRSGLHLLAARSADDARHAARRGHTLSQGGN